MPPKRASARASAAPTPTRISSRTTRSRATPLSDNPSPYVAQRGYLTNSYGDDERQTVPSGVADVNAAKSFAAEMQAKVNLAQERRAERASRALSDSLAQSPPSSIHQTQDSPQAPSTVAEESEIESEIQSSASRASARDRNGWSRSVDRERSMQESFDEDETLPSGGLEPVTRSFNDQYEAGLELPAGLPGFSKLWDSLGSKAGDMFWAAVYVAPLVLLGLLTLAFGPPLAANVVPAVGSLMDNIHLPRLSTPSLPVMHWPSFNHGVTHTVTVAQATQTVTTTSTPHRFFGFDRAMNELNRVRTDMEVMRDRMNRLENQLNAPHKPNFFSPTLGAFVLQQFTSPTRKQGTSLVTRAYFAFFKEFIPPPPIAALKPWTENGDCWCAADSSKGQLSLGINLGKFVYPEQLVVEHISRSDALDITSAPRRLDLWAQLAPDFDIKSVPAAWRQSQLCESPSPDARDEKWLCLGMVAYDVELESSAQSRSLDSYGILPPFKIGKAVIRVLENHGQAYTCLYRIKLAGRIDGARPEAQH